MALGYECRLMLSGNQLFVQCVHELSTCYILVGKRDDNSMSLCSQRSNNVCRMKGSRLMLREHKALCDYDLLNPKIGEIPRVCHVARLGK